MKVYAVVLLVLTGVVCLNADPSPLLSDLLGSGRLLGAGDPLLSLLNSLPTDLLSSVKGLAVDLVSVVACLLKNLAGVDLSNIISNQDALSSLKPYCNSTAGSNLTESQLKELLCLINKSVYSPILIKIFIYKDLMIFLGGNCTSGAIDTLLKNLGLTAVEIIQILINKYGYDAVKKFTLQNIELLASAFSSSQISYLTTKGFTWDDIVKLPCLIQAGFKINVTAIIGPEDLRIVYSVVCPEGNPLIIKGIDKFFYLIAACNPNPTISQDCQSKVTFAVENNFFDICKTIGCQVPIVPNAKDLCLAECLKNTK